MTFWTRREALLRPLRSIRRESTEWDCEQLITSLGSLRRPWRHPDRAVATSAFDEHATACDWVFRPMDAGV